jgi:hypothetical protein
VWDGVWDEESVSEIDTAAKRARLSARKNPFWQGIAGGRGGVSLGYRKPARGPGSWIAKFTLDGVRIEERLGVADDREAPFGALSFAAASAAALTWAKQQAEIADNKDGVDPLAKVPTVKSAVARYITIERPDRSRPAATRRAASSSTFFRKKNSAASAYQSFATLCHSELCNDFAIANILNDFSGLIAVIAKWPGDFAKLRWGTLQFEPAAPVYV